MDPTKALELAKLLFAGISAVSAAIKHLGAHQRQVGRGCRIRQDFSDGWGGR